MKYVAMLALLFVFGCGDDNSSPTSVEQESPYSGYYEISAVAVSNSCSGDIPPPPESVTVNVDGDEIVFDNISRTFDTATKAFACTVSVECEDIGGGCYLCPNYAVHVVFTDSDHFEGTYSRLVSYAFDCSHRNRCVAEWTISGTKADAPGVVE